MGNNYYDNQNVKWEEKLQEILSHLPPYVDDYFKYIDVRKVRTRVGYAQDITVFFQYLENEVMHKPYRKITLQDLDTLLPEDIERYRSYLKYYKIAEKTYTNQENGISRKLSAISGFFIYLLNRERIHKNPMRTVKYPIINSKPIKRLTQDEIYELIQEAESGNKLTARQQKFHEITMVRDVAILMLVLGTGMRVSELVGLDISDINLVNHSAYITRKGGNSDYVYYNDDVAEALGKYMYGAIPDDHSDNPLTYRNNLFPYEIDYNEKALFLSIRGNRMAVRSVQTMVKKYAEKINKSEISVHKLRSTFGTALYNATGDAYTVSKALGHKNIETSRKYISYDEERLKVAEKINLVSSSNKEV